MAREKQNQPDHDTITAFVVAFVGIFYYRYRECGGSERYRGKRLQRGSSCVNLERRQSLAVGMRSIVFFESKKERE